MTSADMVSNQKEKQLVAKKLPFTMGVFLNYCFVSQENAEKINFKLIPGPILFSFALH